MLTMAQGQARSSAGSQAQLGGVDLSTNARYGSGNGKSEIAARLALERVVSVLARSGGEDHDDVR